ncbi:MAG: prephenate dehydrogenase [Actinomycetota bacterium]|nr:prephenate dehydrogenase [Actinomycetota bacterium]
MFKRVAVVGTGLIGGSICLGLRAALPPPHVVAFDTDPDAGRAGLERGAFSEVAESVGEAVQAADLVVVATPVDTTADVCARMLDTLAPDAVVTDVGSAKAGVVEECEALLGARFVGGHPMAGSERHGIAAADAELFQDAWWILTPTAATRSFAYRAASALAATLGARPIAIEPDAHDRLLARLSHLPQVVASGIVAAAVAAEDQESLLGLAAGGFRDVTRIAASDPGMWVSILRSNRVAVLEALEEFSSGLVEVATALREERWGDLAAFLGRARQARMELFAKPQMHDVPVALSLPILDRPGVLAEVTTAAGGLGANIEDLRIVHSTEGGRGRLELIVAGERPAEDLAERLRTLGYRVERGRPA